MTDAIVFQALSWNTVDVEDDSENSKFTVQIFGKTAEGVSVVVFVQGFYPSFCIRFTDTLTNMKFYKKFVKLLKKNLVIWRKTEDSFEEVANLSDDLLEPDEPIIYRKSMWGYDFDKTVGFYNFEFVSLAAYKKIMYLLRSCQSNTMTVRQMKSLLSNVSELEYHEKMDHYRNMSNSTGIPLQCLKFIEKLEKEGLPLEFALGKLFEVIDPVLRFAHKKELRMASWIKVNEYQEVYEKQTTCTLELQCDYGEIEPVINDTICGLIKEMSFDIECYDPEDLFPDPKLPEDVVFQISVTFKFYKDKIATRYLLHFHPTVPCKEIPEIEVCIRGNCENLPELCKNKECQSKGHRVESASVIVENFTSERDLLLRFTELITIEDPDFIYTYNGDMFDFSYMMVRAEICGCFQEFCKMSKLLDYDCKVEEKKFTSAAYGDNKYLRVEIPGRLNVDLMIWIQRNMPVDRYPNYQLNTVAKIEINQKKRDIEFKQIFKAFRTNDADLLCKIGDYCVQDTVLVQNLVVKLDVVTQMFEMANITDVPASYLMQKGQQIKVFSIICKDAMNKGFVVPLLDLRDDSSFTGAIVLDVTPGIFQTPVSVLDFASLYPSIQVAFKICYSTIVLSDPLQKRLADLKSKGDSLELNGTKFDFIEWQDTVIRQKATGKLFSNLDHAKETLKLMRKEINADLKGLNEKFEYYCKNNLYFYAQNTTSIIPDIQVRLKASRKSVRKDMGIIEFSDNPEEQLRYRVLNGRQLAIKVTMNSIYGFTSAFMLNLSALSASVTAKGRQMIETTRNFMENEFEAICRRNLWTHEDCITFYNESGRQVVTDSPHENWIRKFPAAICGEPWTSKELNIHVVGGDSVTEDTPILCKKPDGTMTYRTIDSLGEGPWIKQIDGKEYQQCSVKVWSDKGFTDVKWIIRHKTDKQLYRVNTVSGIVDVTEDHSLLDPNGGKLKPTEVFIGSKLLHSDNLPTLDIEVTFNSEYAWVLGFFYADGSCGSYYWALNNQNVSLLKRAKAVLELYHPGIIFYILDTIESSGVYKLSPNSNGVYGAIAKLVAQFRTLFYDLKRLKKVPDCILNANEEIRSGFLQGYYAGDGYYSDTKNKGLECSNKGKIGAASLFHLFTSLGYTTIIDFPQDNFRLRAYSRKKTENGRKIANLGVILRELNEIRKISALPKSSQFVYDLETENHHFHVGPGTLIVHNTDSVFANFPNSTLEETISLNHKAEVILTDEIFNRHPIEMEYEKSYCPMVIVKKKNYIGVKYEMDAVRWKVDYKGIAIKRRNYCPFVKDTYWKVLYPALGISKEPSGKLVKDFTGLGPQKAIQYLKGSMDNLLSLSEIQNIPSVEFYDNFLISASLKSAYKSETLPHVQLAKRMNERDPCSSPKPGSRFSYLIVRDLDRTDEISAKSEDPLFAFEKKLPLDYIFYLENQIKKPVLKFLDIIGVSREANEIFQNTYDKLLLGLKKKIQVRALEARKRFFTADPMKPLELKQKKQKVTKKKGLESGIVKIDKFFVALTNKSKS